MLPLVVQVEEIDARTAQTCAFRKSPVRVGRNSLNDLVLEERYVSQWHAVIRFDAERVTYLDLGSTNPTQIDGKPVARNVEVVIKSESVVQIGRIRLHFLRDEVGEEFFGILRKSAFSEGPQTGLPEASTTMYFASRSGARSGQSWADAGLQAMVENLGRVKVAPKAQPAIHIESSTAPVSQSPQEPGSVRPRQASSGAEDALSLPTTLTESFRHFRAAWDNLLVMVRRDLESVPQAEREERVYELQARFPGIGKEAGFREMVAELGVDPKRTGEPEIADWFRRLTDGLFPPLGAPINQAVAMERVGAILEIFADGFIALRKAQEEFASAMSLRLDENEDHSMLQRADISAALLAYLLDPGPGGSLHLSELRRALADSSLHHVGLVGAVVEGTRAVLEQLSPAEVAEEVGAAGGLFSRLSRGAEAMKWGAFIRAYERLVDEDRFTRTLFGRAFARRYYQSVAGRRPSNIPPQRD